MDAIELLKNYKKRLDPLLEDYFRKELTKPKEIEDLANQSIKIVRDFTLASGKRVRPALVYYAYLAAGGSEEEKIVDVSKAIELTHVFLLIHDDIVDRDDMRHGIDTVHVTYKKLAENNSYNVNSDHFGKAVAIFAGGDLLYAMANQIVLESDFSPEVKIKALKRLQGIVYEVIPGEYLDVVLGVKDKATEEEIIQMYKGKTGGYTFEGPIQLGAIFAGADDDFIQSFSGYSIPLGIAFQIRDDILGIYGDEKKLGKPVGSDIIEGKQTILVAKALEVGNEEQKSGLKELLGKEGITEGEIEEFRKIITESGSLKYAEDLMGDYVSRATKALEKIEIKNEEAKKFFKGIATYIAERKN